MGYLTLGKTRIGISILGLVHWVSNVVLNPNMFEISEPFFPIWSGDHSELGDEEWVSPGVESIQSELLVPPHSTSQLQQHPNFLLSCARLGEHDKMLL